MKIVVSVIVFNRLNNVKRWISCWKASNTKDAELVVIHNDNGESDKFKAVCDQEGIKYIKRENIGFDIGAFQDVVRDRLPGFPEWEYLLWCTDDCVPMSKDFITPFIETLQDELVGISCMKISTAVNAHVRTTGFCLKKEVAQKLEFHSDPLKTKQECYLFEHRGGPKTLTNQIRAMGLSCRQVAPSAVSPLWDVGYHKRLNRAAEHERVFPTTEVQGNKVMIICPIYHNYPQLISSLICQTETNWELMLIHDGPSANGLSDMVKDFKDERIKYMEHPEHTGLWGHKLRKWGLEQIRDRNDIGFVVVQNPDNYLTPRYLEYLLKGFEKNHTAVATYCSDTVHSYKNWHILPAKLERGYLDCGAVMIKKEVACEVGWNNFEHSADWVFFEEIAHRYSWRNFVKVSGVLFVHN